MKPSQHARKHPRPRPRKAHRRAPGRQVINTMQIAATQAQRLSEADVRQQAALGRNALTQLMRGREGDFHWASLADMANMAETLADMGLGAGQEAERVISTAQRVLAEVYQRHAERNTWALHAVEVEAFEWLISLHTTQLAATSYGEFEAAYRRTANRIHQALQGNAAPGVRVIAGLVGAAHEPAQADA